MQSVGKHEEERPGAGQWDQRLWPRGAAEISGVTLWTSVEDFQKVEILNESLTGVAVLVDDASRLSPESEVRLIFHGEPMWALVRYVEPAEDGKHRIGLEWGCSENRIDPLDFPTGDSR